MLFGPHPWPQMQLFHAFSK